MGHVTKSGISKKADLIVRENDKIAVIKIIDKSELLSGPGF